MTVTTHTYDAGVLGSTLVASGDLNTVYGTPKYTYGLTSAGAVRLTDTSVDYLYYNGPSTDYSGSLTFRVDVAPSTGAVRVAVARSDLNGDLSQFRVSSNGDFQITDESTVNAEVMGTWETGVTYLLQWQADDTAETITWRVTPYGGSHTEGVADISGSPSTVFDRIYVGGPGSSTSNIVVDNLTYDDEATLSWLPALPLRVGTFRWDSTNFDEIPIPAGGATYSVVPWSGSGGVGVWPPRPTNIDASAPVKWSSVLDLLAPPPLDAVAGDTWDRAPGAAF